MIYIYGEQQVFETGLSFKYFLKERYGVNDLTCYPVYQITPSKLIDESELSMLRDIFDAHCDNLPENGFYLQPPMGQVSPWGLKFSQMVKDLHFQSTHQVERFFYISLAGKKIDFYTQKLIAEQFKPQIFERSNHVKKLVNTKKKREEWLHVEDLYDQRLLRILYRFGMSHYQLPVDSIQKLLKSKTVLPSTLLAFCLNPGNGEQSLKKKAIMYNVSEIFIRNSNHHYVMKSSDKYLISSGMTMQSNILACAMKISGYALFEENHGGDLSCFSLVTQRNQIKKKTWSTYSQLSGIPIPIIRVVNENAVSLAFSVGSTTAHRSRFSPDTNIILMGIPKMSRLKLKSDEGARQDYLIQQDPYYLNPEIMRRFQAIFLRINDLDVNAVFEVMSLANRPLGYHMIEYAKKTGLGFNIEVDQIPRSHEDIRDEDVLYQLWNDALLLVVDNKHLSTVIDIIDREVCPYHVIGTMRSDERMIFSSDKYLQPILDIQLSEYNQVKIKTDKQIVEQELIHETNKGLEGSMQQQLIDWVYHENFLDPQANLANVDVSCYGDLVQGMMVGPWQTAVNQVVVLDHGGLKVAHSLISYRGTDIIHLISYVLFRMLQYQLKREQLKIFLLLPVSCQISYIEECLAQFSDIDIQWKQDPLMVDMYASITAVMSDEGVLISPYAKIEEGQNLFCIVANQEEGSVDRAYQAIIEAHEKGLLKAYVGLDQCLWGAILRILFSSRLGANIHVPSDDQPSLTVPLLGALVQVSDHHEQELKSIMPSGIYFSKVAQLQEDSDIKIEVGSESIDMNLLHLRKIWSKDWLTWLTKMARSFDEYFSVDQFLSPLHKGLANQKLPESLGTYTKKLDDVKIAILRDRGSFGHFHLARVLNEMGVNVADITYTDLIEGRHTLREFQCLLLPGGATYGDEGSAGLITAKKVLSHQHLCKEFEQFFMRSDTLVLGFGNGGQVLAHLQELIAGAHWPIPQKNLDQEFHSRKFLVDIMPSPCVVLKDLENTRLMCSFGCRFGHISKVESSNHVCASTKNPTVDSFISVENNPLHNDQGAYGFTSENGRVSWFLFHPEYHIENYKYDYYDPWAYEKSPWAQIFYTMVNWLVENRSDDQ